MEWTHDDNVYLVGSCKNALDNNKYACFDLDDTLITTKSGKTFAEDGDDWKFTFKNVPKKIKELHDDDYNIVIISNQAGLIKKTDGTEWWKNKVENIIKEFGVPVAVYAALDHDHHRKPFPTFWDMISDKKKINMKKSFYCGDACGRKTDFSDTDLKFALNCGLEFILPENLFDSQKVKVPDVSYPVDFDEIPTESTYTFTPAKNEMIIMVGVPGSGKSTFAKKYIVPHKYGIINRDTSKTIPKCLKECQRYIYNGMSVVIDNTNPTVEAREKFMSLAKANGYTCRCIIMDTDVSLAKHNASYRHYMSGGAIDSIPDIVYNTYKKKYEPPTTKEGFTDIQTVKFSLGKDIDETKYKLYYIGKSKRAH